MADHYFETTQWLHFTCTENNLYWKLQQLVGVIPWCIWEEKTQYFSKRCVNDEMIFTPHNHFRIDLGEGMFVEYFLNKTDTDGIFHVRLYKHPQPTGAITNKKKEEEQCSVTLSRTTHNETQTQTE